LPVCLLKGRACTGVAIFQKMNELKLNLGTYWHFLHTGYKGCIVGTGSPEPIGSNRVYRDIWIEVILRDMNYPLHSCTVVYADGHDM
jgi:hypothetical protein